MKKNPQTILTAVILLAILCVLGYLGQQGGKLRKYSEARILMATTIKVDVCHSEKEKEDARGSLGKVWERLEEIAWRMNVYDEQSDVAKINQSSMFPVELPQDTYNLIKQSLILSEKTEGAFDITVWPMIRLWKEGAKRNLLPTEEQIRLVLESIGSQQIELSENTLRLRHPLTKIDLGGIAKGYAIDEAARILREGGFDNFFIDAGGDIYGGGRNCLRKSWRVGIRNPLDTTQLADIIQISNLAVTTSGNYEKFLEIQGQRWSHIINPLTGYPQKDVISATVIAPTATEADAYATALTVLGDPAGTMLINELKGKYASLILLREDKDNFKRFTSKKYKDFQLKH